MAARGSKGGKAIAVNTQPSKQQLAAIDRELNDDAANIAKQVGGGGGGKYVKVKSIGEFHGPDGFNFGSEIQVVVLNFLSKNWYYDAPYNESNPQPPVCFAKNKVIEDMVPVPESPQRQADACNGCWANEFKSNATGKGKACKNTRELAILIVDPDNPDAHNAPDAPIYLLSLSPKQLQPFTGIVNGIARTFGGHPIKAMFTIQATNAGSYAQLSFHDPVANPNYAQHAMRRAEAWDLLDTVPDFTPRQAAQPARSPARPAARRPAPTRPAAAGRK